MKTSPDILLSVCVWGGIVQKLAYELNDEKENDTQEKYLMERGQIVISCHLWINGK